MMTRYLFHVTTLDRVESILRGGLDPAKSKGKNRSVWMAYSLSVLYAIKHIAARKNVAINGLAIIVVRADAVQTVNSQFAGIVRSNQRVSPRLITSVWTTDERGKTWRRVRCG